VRISRGEVILEQHQVLQSRAAEALQTRELPLEPP
jgi:hypothetical protein